MQKKKQARKLTRVKVTQIWHTTSYILVKIKGAFYLFPWDRTIRMHRNKQNSGSCNHGQVDQRSPLA